MQVHGPEGAGAYRNARPRQEGGKVIGEVVAVVVEEGVRLWGVDFSHVAQIFIPYILWDLSNPEYSQVMFRVLTIWQGRVSSHKQTMAICVPIPQIYHLQRLTKRCGTRSGLIHATTVKVLKTPDNDAGVPNTIDLQTAPGQFHSQPL